MGPWRNFIHHMCTNVEEACQVDKQCFRLGDKQSITQSNPVLLVWLLRRCIFR
jgi:hypothetical protein